MNLKEQAIIVYKGFVNSQMNEEGKIYQAGWHKLEWTCCKCGCMIGRNLKGEIPHLLARQHAKQCAEKSLTTVKT